MRGLSVLDVLIMLAVAALLIFAASQDFGRYAEHTVALPATPTPAPGT